MKFSVYIVFILYAIYGCKSKNSYSEQGLSLDDSSTLRNNSIELPIEVSFPRNRGEKEFSDMLISFSALRGVDFLKHTGRSKGVDEQSLKDEIVFIMDFKLKNSRNDILSHSSMTQNELVKYFIGSIQDDVSFIQNKRSIFPSGVHYEGRIGAGHKVKVYFFVTGLDLDSSYELIYKDKAFDKGQMKLIFNNPDILG